MTDTTIITGDARAVLGTLPSASAHCAVTSPPYYGLRDYGVAGQIGLEKQESDFFEALGSVFLELKRVLRDDGTLWVNMGDTYINGQMGGFPWRLAFLLQSLGWRLRADIIWHKPNPMPEPDRGRPTVAHEYLFLFAKSKRYFYDAEAIREPAERGSCGSRFDSGKTLDHHGGLVGNGPRLEDGKRNKRSVWTIPCKGSDIQHFAMFPPALVEPCILAGTSAHGCCSSCGAPFARVTAVSDDYADRLGSSWHDHQSDLSRGQRGCPPAFRGGVVRSTTGWEPTCDCDAGPPSPCTVLDPFSGMATTGIVARRLQRRYIGIELNPDYAERSRARLAENLPLFNTKAEA